MIRVRREFMDDVKNVISGCDQMWCPSETQFGTKWLPVTLFGADLTGMVNKDLSQDQVERMWYLYLIQVVISILPSIIACISKCCSEDDQRSEKRAGVAGGSSSFSTFLIGLFGLLAIKFNCQELLMASTITAIISIVLTVVYLLIMLCGLCQLCRSADGCCDRLYRKVVRNFTL